MSTKKEDFFSKLQFDLGDRWPELDPNDISTIDQLADFIIKRSKINPWPFLRFLTYFNACQTFLSGLLKQAVSPYFNLNELSVKEKNAFISFTKAEFGEPLAFRRPKTMRTVVFVFPILAILLPMIVSTYLITAKSYSGWLYLSGLIGLIISIGAFELTKRFKKRIEPDALLEYSKSFYVIHNQKLTEEPSRDQLLDLICQIAKSYYKIDFSADSTIPES